MKIIALLGLAACLTGCSVATRNAGNLLTLTQKVGEVNLGPGQAVAVNGNETSRQGASGAIVNNFYIGESANTQAADKKQAGVNAAATAAVSQAGDAANNGNAEATANDTPPPKPKVAVPAAPPAPSTPIDKPKPPILTDLDEPAPTLSLGDSPPKP